MRTIVYSRDIVWHSHRELVNDSWEGSGERPHQRLANDVDVVRIIDCYTPQSIPELRELAVNCKLRKKS